MPCLVAVAAESGMHKNAVFNRFYELQFDITFDVRLQINPLNGRLTVRIGYGLH
jgi:hypothetical protein